MKTCLNRPHYDHILEPTWSIPQNSRGRELHPIVLVLLLKNNTIGMDETNEKKGKVRHEQINKVMERKTGRKQERSKERKN
jgi:hypothetical protein